jgi:hypothetical protein
VIINFPKTLNVNNDKQTVTPSSHKKCTSIEIRKAKKAKKKKKKRENSKNKPLENNVKQPINKKQIGIH